MRREIENRPLLIAFFFFVVGLTLKIHPYHILALVVIPLLSKRSMQFAGVVAVLVGFLLAPGSNSSYNKGFVRLSGTVLEAPIRNIDTTEIKIREGGQEYRLIVDNPNSLGLGDRISVSGQQSDKGFVRVEQAVLLEKGGFLARTAQGVRDSFEAYVRSLPSRVGDLVDGLCFQVGRVSPAMSEELGETGLAHILSVSGLQALVIALGLQALGGRLDRYRWLSWIALSVVLALYCAASGFHSATLRAFITASTLGLAHVLRRERDVPSALALAGIFNLALRPDDLYRPGFQITYLAVAGYWLVSRTVGSHSRWIWNLGGAAVAILPLQVYWFKEFSLVTFIANLLILTVVPPLVSASLFAYLLPWLGIRAFLNDQVVTPLAGWILFVADNLRFGGKPALLTLPELNPYWIGCLYVAILASWRPKVRLARVGAFFSRRWSSQG